MHPFRPGAAHKPAITRLLALAAAAVLSTNVFAAGAITGAGSTWVYPLVA
jgi:ABC-type phosphate transport system substrate-binding protein